MPKPQFAEELRTYNTPLGILPSVTTVLKVLNKPALLQWAVNQALEKVKQQINFGGYDLDDILKEAKSTHKTILDEAADLGSQMHKLIEDDLNDALVRGDVPDGLVHSWVAWLDWKDSHKVQPFYVEQEVYHTSGFAGTLDFYGLVNDKPHIIDFKSSNGVWPEYTMQVAAYSKAWQEMTGNPVEGWAILRLDKKTGEPEYVEFTESEIELAWQKFSYILSYFLLENRGKLDAKKEA